MMIDESITAIHEAGHAIVSWSVGVEFLLVSIVGATGRYRGAVSYLMPESPDSLYWEKRLAISFGGMIAEKLFGLLVDPDSAASDFQNAKTYLRRMGYLSDCNPDLVKWKYYFEIQAAFDRPAFKKAVAAVADALLRHKELDYVQTLEAMQSGVAGQVLGDLSLLVRETEIKKKLAEIGGR